MRMYDVIVVGAGPAGCRVDYAVGCVFFAGEVAGFLNPICSASGVLWEEWLARSGRWSCKGSFSHVAIMKQFQPTRSIAHLISNMEFLL